MDKLILFFIDGIGLAPRSPHNRISRLFEGETSGAGLTPSDVPRVTDRSVFCSLDACLGVEGIPQSATGQTSLFTGINAPRYLGYHLTAFPNEPLLPFFRERSIMKVLADKGVKVTSANLYSEQFFTERENAVKNRFPASTLTIRSAGVPFRMVEEYRQGKAVFADITNDLIRRRGMDIDPILPEEAAGRTLRILEENHFVFFEYFLTDHYGHKRDAESLDSCVDILDGYVSSLAAGLDREREALLIVSDHGNSEDLLSASHTLNPVPGLLIGGSRENRDKFARCRDLTDIYRFMQDYYD